MPGSLDRSAILKSLRVKGWIVLVLCCAACLLIIYRFSISSPQRSDLKKNTQPTIAITTGFDNTYRTDSWTPVHITVQTHASAFQGKLAIHTVAEGDRLSSAPFTPWSFEQSINLAKNTTNNFTITAPHYTDNLLAHGFLTSLLNNEGKIVTQQMSRPGNEVQPGNILIGLLSQDDALADQLSRILIPDQVNFVTVSHLNASTFPTQEIALENFDVIVLDNFETQALSMQQMDTLRTWVNQGGILIVVGGNAWQQTLAPLPADLLPVSIQDTHPLPAGTHVLSFNGPTNTLSNTDIPPVSPTISTASIHTQGTFSQQQTLLSTGDTPLIVKAHQGAGTVCYLAFDPASPPLTQWNGATMFWQSLLQETLSERLLIASNAQNYDDGPGNLLTRGGLVSFLTSGPPQGPMLIGIVLLCYLILLGPVRLLLIYRYRWMQLTQWRVIMSIIVIFATLAYGMAAYQKSVAVTENSVSLIQINQDGTSAHTTTYMGILSPQTGDVSLQIPQNSQVEPINQAYLQGNQALSPYSHAIAPMTIQAHTNGTTMTLHTTNLWSFNPVIMEQDQQLVGKLSGHIMLIGHQLVGSVTNMLPSTLSDVYILMPHNFIPLGTLAPQQTHEINSTLQNTQPPPELTLSDLIAKHMGLPTPYFPFQYRQRPQTTQENHMAMLSALSGVGYSYAACQGSCLTHAIVNKNEIYVTGGQIPDPNLKNDYDPLLIPGAPATLVGWADQNIATNNDTSTTITNSPQGQHMNFIQMPLSVSYSGPFTIPLDFITGNPIDVESYDAGAILPGAYSLSTGNVTFELPLPSTPNMSINSATITIPDLLIHPSGPNSGSSISVSNIRKELYNWNTHRWEEIRSNRNDSFTTTQITQFVGPYNRILIRISNMGTNQIYFGKPTLSLNGRAD